MVRDPSKKEPKGTSWSALFDVQTQSDAPHTFQERNMVGFEAEHYSSVEDALINLDPSVLKALHAKMAIDGIEGPVPIYYASKDDTNRGDVFLEPCEGLPHGAIILGDVLDNKDGYVVNGQEDPVAFTLSRIITHETAHHISDNVFESLYDDVIGDVYKDMDKSYKSLDKNLKKDDITNVLDLCSSYIISHKGFSIPNNPADFDAMYREEILEMTTKYAAENNLKFSASDLASPTFTAYMDTYMDASFYESSATAMSENFSVLVANNKASDTDIDRQSYGSTVDEGATLKDSHKEQYTKNNDFFETSINSDEYKLELLSKFVDYTMRDGKVTHDEKDYLDAVAGLLNAKVSFDDKDGTQHDTTTITLGNTPDARTSITADTPFKG